MQPCLYSITVVSILLITVVALLIQRIFKQYLDSDQYYYLKEVTIVAAWALIGIWVPEGALRITIATAVAAACIGFCQKVSKNKKLKFLYLLLALSFSVFGPRIAFIEYFNGEYYHFSYLSSLLLSTLWVGVTPIFLQELDEKPGFAGTFITLNWLIITTIIMCGNCNIEMLSYVCMTGTILLLVFWSRHLHPYRRLTEPLSALWGTLLAGLSIYAISNGVTFDALTIIPLSFYMVQLVEILISALTALFCIHPLERFMLYKNIIKTGRDHISALGQTVVISSVFPIIFGFIILPFTLAIRIFLMLIFMLTIIFTFYKIGYTTGDANIVRKPALWGIKVDNISLNYALAKVRNWVVGNEKGNIIVTPDALAALRSRTDKRYSEIVEKAGLVLPDGAGLMLAMKLLGTPIQERIPGVEFTEHLCSKASYEGWGVWFLGGAPGVADTAAAKLQEKYPDLIISGTHDGYFPAEETESLCKTIANSGAKILFVGLGVPKQEYWLQQYIQDTGVVVGMGIGGTMDVISGKLKRAPQVWQKFALEWLFRVLQEPKRFKRILRLPVFVFYLTLTLLHIDRYNNNI